MSGEGTDCVRVERDSPAYPRRVRERLAEAAPAALFALGDLALLREPLTALFCSVRVPPELVLPGYDLARALREEGVPVVGGFQSPLERECLEYLLRGGQPVVVSPARAIGRMRLPRAWREPVRQGRMLVVSGCGAPRRPSRETAARRNLLVAALAERVWVVHASPGGMLHRAVEAALEWGVPVACPAHPANRDLLLRGAGALGPREGDARLARLPARW